MNSVDKKSTGTQSANIKNQQADKQGFDKKQNLGNSNLDQQDRTSAGKSDFQKDQKRASSLKDY